MGELGRGEADFVSGRQQPVVSDVFRDARTGCERGRGGDIGRDRVCGGTAQDGLLGSAQPYSGTL